MKILEIDFVVMKLVYVNWFFGTETFSQFEKRAPGTVSNINNDYNMALSETC